MKWKRDWLLTAAIVATATLILVLAILAAVVIGATT